MSLEIRTTVFEAKDVWKFLNTLDRKAFGKLKRAAGNAMKAAWKDAVDDSKIHQHSGYLKNSVEVRSKSFHEVEMTVRASYAAPLYNGANPGVGRFVPEMPCLGGRSARLVNPWRKRRVKIKTYWQFMDLWSQGLVTELKPGVFRSLKMHERRHPGRPKKGRPIRPYTADVNVDIGIWPGINARRLGLRSRFEELVHIYVIADVVRALEKVTGVKLI